MDFGFMKIDLSINPEKSTEKICAFIRKTVQDAGFKQVVLGLSGGLDSAVSAALAAQALGSENTHVGIFPYGKISAENQNDVKCILNHLAIQPCNIHTINIQPIVDAIIVGSDLKSTQGLTQNERKGNVMARIRMILLFDFSKKIPALVLGTENKTEHLLGYFTRFGDSASDIEPIQSLYKTQVRQLAQYLKIPQSIISKAPTAGLWAGQTDEGDFGFSYEDADKILYLFIDKKIQKQEIIKQGFNKLTIEKVLGRMEKNSFKHKTPYTLVV
jgi:NAD+ synthase